MGLGLQLPDSAGQPSKLQKDGQGIAKQEQQLQRPGEFKGYKDEPGDAHQGLQQQHAKLLVLGGGGWPQRPSNQIALYPRRALAPPAQTTPSHLVAVADAAANKEAKQRGDQQAQVLQH